MRRLAREYRFNRIQGQVAEGMVAVLKRNWTATAVRIVLVALYTVPASQVFSAFPSDYSWSEMMINYQGGLMRRGLVGELAYLINCIMPASYFMTGTLLVAYGVTLTILVVGLRLADSFPGAYLPLSPVGPLFVFHDPHAFGRKDAFILLALTDFVTIIRSSLRAH